MMNTVLPERRSPRPVTVEGSEGKTPERLSRPTLMRRAILPICFCPRKIPVSGRFTRGRCVKSQTVTLCQCGAGSPVLAAAVSRNVPSSGRGPLEYEALGFPETAEVEGTNEHNPNAVTRPAPGLSNQVIRRSIRLMNRLQVPVFQWHKGLKFRSLHGMGFVVGETIGKRYE